MSNYQADQWINLLLGPRWSRRTWQKPKNRIAIAAPKAVPHHARGAYAGLPFMATEAAYQPPPGRSKS